MTQNSIETQNIWCMSLTNQHFAVGVFVLAIGICVSQKCNNSKELSLLSYCYHTSYLLRLYIYFLVAARLGCIFGQTWNKTQCLSLVIYNICCCIDSLRSVTKHLAVDYYESITSIWSIGSAERWSRNAKWHIQSWRYKVLEYNHSSLSLPENHYPYWYKPTGRSWNCIWHCLLGSVTRYVIYYSRSNLFWYHGI